ncbi:MAG: FAD:protein FMN transferase [Gammaproteobacteria bacterium]
MIRKNYPYWFLIISLFSLVACSQTDSTNNEIKDSQFIFGTIVDITFYGDNNMKATEALQTISNDFKHMHKAWQPWGNMAMARANKLIVTTEWFSYNPSIHDLLVDGKKYSRLSHGLFNPAMGRFTKLWGFNTDKLTVTAPPAATEINALLDKMPSMNDLQIKGVRIKSSNPNVFFDFGAMAKGLAVDKAIKSLNEFNIHNAMINAGGDIKVIGKHGDRPWHIGIRHPRKKDSILAGIDLLANESIFTSGDYERYFMYKGVRYHHIIDPRTGYPATKSISVTVIHPDAALADAAATALFVAGPDEWYEIAQSMGIKYVLLVDANGGIHMNPAMQQRISFIEKPDNISISKPL